MFFVVAKTTCASIALKSKGINEKAAVAIKYVKTFRNSFLLKRVPIKQSADETILAIQVTAGTTV